MNIPLIKADLPSLAAVEQPFHEILANGRITNFGRYVQQFEAAAGDFLGCEVVAVSSGTMALLFALQAVGLERDQKVILPSFTFMATGQAILYAGGIPIFAEVGEDLMLCPKDLEQLLAEHTDAACVIGVHMYGLPCDTDAIERVTAEAGKRSGRAIPVIYDAAHAFGAARNGRRAGTFGTAETFSLSVTKALVSVEGGMVSSNDRRIIERIRKMRNYGIDEPYDAAMPGMNGKMSEFHAIVGLENLHQLERSLARRREKAEYFASQIATRTSFQLIPTPAGSVHTYKDFTVMVPDGLAGRRDAIIAFLKSKGVETRPYFFPPVHEQKFFRRFATRRLPRTEELSRRVITLPFFTTIEPAQMDYVAEALAEAERSLA